MGEAKQKGTFEQRRAAAMTYDSTNDTKDHQQRVYDLLLLVVEELATRAAEHDLSKLGSVEKPIIDKRESMRIALDHHYSVNRHHPEHFKKYKCVRCFKRFDIELITCPECGSPLFTIEQTGVKGMSLIDVIEMVADVAAVSIHNRDDILKRFASHHQHFGYSDELAWIIQNTIEVFDV